jgi:hypothetical protein
MSWLASMRLVACKLATARTALCRLSSEIHGLSRFTALARRFVSTASFRDSRSASRVSTATNV